MTDDASTSTGNSGTSAAGSGIASQASSAIDQFRSVGKWIITSFAAVGTLLLAGVQLTSLGSLTGWRLFVAIAGLAVAVIAVIAAIATLTSLLEPHVSAPDQAVKDADNPRTELGKFVADHQLTLFPSGINTAGQLATEFDAIRSATTGSQAAREKRLAILRNSLSDIVWWSAYLGAKERFDRTRTSVVRMAVLVAIGAILYAWAATSTDMANSASSPSAAVQAMPVTVLVKLTPAGSSALSEVLSRSCIAVATKGGVQAIALSADSSQTTLVLIPIRHICPTPIEISLPVSEGIAIPESKVKPVASPRPSKSPSEPSASPNHG